MFTYKFTISKVLHFFLSLKIYIWYHFSLAWRAFFSISCNQTVSLFLFIGKFWIFPLFLKDNLVVNRILGWPFFLCFSFSDLKMIFCVCVLVSCFWWDVCLHSDYCAHCVICPLLFFLLLLRFCCCYLWFSWLCEVFLWLRFFLWYCPLFAPFWKLLACVSLHIFFCPILFTLL